MKKIMILGAGIYQVPLIKTAKRLGLYTIVVSIPGNYPGFALADKVYYENTVDDEKILEIAKEEQIDGIITTGTDVCVITIGKVCDAMGLSGLSYEAAQIAVDKMLMKTKYEEYGVRTARFRKVLFSDPDSFILVILKSAIILLHVLKILLTSFHLKLPPSYSSTVTPMLLHVPAIIDIAASTLAALRSAIFVSAIF